MKKFICGFKYSQSCKYQCQLFNFILRHAKIWQFILEEKENMSMGFVMI